MILVEDKAQKIDQHEVKNRWWKSQGNAYALYV